MRRKSSTSSVRKLDCTLIKEPQNYILHFSLYGVTMFKTQSNLIKDRNIIFAVSKRCIKHFKKYQTVLVS